MTTPKNIDVTAESPNDLELMRFYDGELDDAARERVEAELGEMGEARDKLATMAMVGDLLREQVNEDERADAILDGVMAGLEQVDAAGEEVGAELIELDDHRPQPGLEPSSELRSAAASKPANDNARSIFAMAAVAAAVAVGLFFWGSSSPEQEVADTARGGPTSLLPETAATQAAPAAAAAVAEAEDDEAEDDEAEDDEESGGVEIASVDFGSQSGSVFYVSSDPSAGATAVVWVTDTGDDQ